MSQRDGGVGNITVIFSDEERTQTQEKERNIIDILIKVTGKTGLYVQTVGSETQVKTIKTAKNKAVKLEQNMTGNLMKCFPSQHRIWNRYQSLLLSRSGS